MQYKKLLIIFMTINPFFLNGMHFKIRFLSKPTSLNEKSRDEITEKVEFQKKPIKLKIKPQARKIDKERINNDIISEQAVEHKSILEYAQAVNSFDCQQNRFNYVIDSQEIFKKLIFSYTQKPQKNEYKKLVICLENDPRSLNCILHTLVQLTEKDRESFIDKIFKKTEKFVTKEFGDQEDKKIGYLSLLLRPNIYNKNLQKEVSEHKHKLNTWLLCCKNNNNKVPKVIKNKIINYSYNEITSPEEMKNIANTWSVLRQEIKNFMCTEGNGLSYTVMTTLGEKECGKNSYGRDHFSAKRFDDWFLERGEKLFGVAQFDKDSNIGSLFLG